MTVVVIAIVVLVTLAFIVDGYAPRHPLPPKPTPRLHDWRARGWGNDYIITPQAGSSIVTITGWRTGITVGDVLYLAGKGKDGPPVAAAYVVDEIRYFTDPRDMFEATLHYERGLVTESDGRLVLAGRAAEGMPANARR